MRGVPATAVPSCFRRVVGVVEPLPICAEISMVGLILSISGIIRSVGFVLKTGVYRQEFATKRYRRSWVGGSHFATLRLGAPLVEPLILKSRRCFMVAANPVTGCVSVESGGFPAVSVRNF